MSLLLCRQEAVSRPYYVEALDVHLYSSQELCYVIYHHPLLVMEEFVDERLIGFIRDELNMGNLAARLEKGAGGENSDELLFAILTECFYYTPPEISQYRQRVASLRKKTPAEFEKERADYLFSIGQYGKAVQIYETLLESGNKPEERADREFTGKLWNNLGAAYARLFQTTKAFQAYEKAGEYLGMDEPERKMYFLAELNPELRSRLRPSDQEKREAWEREAGEAREKAAQSREILKLEQLLERDPEEGLEEAAEMVKKWKREYRSMV